MNKHKEIVFYGPHARELDMEDKIRLKDEFIKRFALFGYLLASEYSEWKKEFDALYPDKDIDSVEYRNFVAKKCRYLLVDVNSAEIGLNDVRMYFSYDSLGYAYGWAENFGGLYIHLDA